MAQHTVSHTCGHDQTHQLFGPHKERDRKLVWLESTLCSECYHKQKDADRATHSANAAESNAQAGLVLLTGSERQIAWAESLRAPVCAALAEFERRLEIDPHYSPAAVEEFGDGVALVVDEIRSQASSKWWIETGQHLCIRDAGSAGRHVLEQVEERKLAPTAMREVEERATRKRIEEEANRLAWKALLPAILDAYSTDGLSYDPTSHKVTSTILGHTVEYDRHHYFRGYAGAVLIDGKLVEEPGVLRTRLAEFGTNVANAIEAAARKERSDSLRGATITRVGKTKQVLVVELDNGRILKGLSSRDGWFLDTEHASGRVFSINGSHPEVVRIAAEAKAWAKRQGVK
jgi:hypothetical protein